MQLGSLTRFFRRESRTYDGNLFLASAEGRGQDVVFIHGLAASPHCWEQAVELLGPGVRCHFIHIRGFAGEAPSPDRKQGDFLKPLADELAVYLRLHTRGDAAIVGHSMGGLVTLILARDHPELVGRAMVLDVPAYFSVLINPFASNGAMASFAEATRRRYVENDQAAFESHLRSAAQKLATDPVTVERIIHWGIASDRQMTADVMAEVMTTDLRPDLAKITAPVEVLYAWDRSGPATRAGLDQIYASSYSGLAHQRRLRIDNSRHYIMFDQPEVLYRAVRDWLAAQSV
jgi:pimeloyl-ACP methyl ester carboxylesterase